MVFERQIFFKILDAPTLSQSQLDNKDFHPRLKCIIFQDSTIPDEPTTWIKTPQQMTTQSNRIRPAPPHMAPKDPAIVVAGPLVQPGQSSPVSITLKSHHDLLNIPYG